MNYVVTVPGPWGEPTALWAEFAISLVLMTAILVFANTPRLARFTPWAAGILLAAYIAIESPYSGTSMNPARTLGSALPAGDISLALDLLRRAHRGHAAGGAHLPTAGGTRRVFCAKLHHHNNQPCIFHCQWKEMENQ